MSGPNRRQRRRAAKSRHSNTDPYADYQKWAGNSLDDLNAAVEAVRGIAGASPAPGEHSHPVRPEPVPERVGADSIAVVTREELNLAREYAKHAKAGYDLRKQQMADNVAPNDETYRHIDFLSQHVAEDLDRAARVATYMIQASHDYVMAGFGSWGAFCDDQLGRALDSRQETDDVVAILRHCDNDDVSHYHQAVTAATGPQLLSLTASLAGLYSRASEAGMTPIVLDADPDGKGFDPRLTMEEVMDRAGWSPDPRKLPEWRARLYRQFGTEPMRISMTTALDMGQSSMFPIALDTPVAASVLLDQERERLAHARLYVMDPETWPVIERKAAHPRTQGIVATRVPSPYGFVMFPRSIVPEAGAPIVAISWGTWRNTTTATPFGWAGKSTLGHARLSEGFDDPARTGYWITFYTQWSSGYQRAARVAGAASQPFSYENETVALVGADLPSEVPDKATTDYPLRYLLACWDAISQGRGKALGKPITDITVKARKPTHARADRRRGLTDGGDVHIVKITGQQRRAKGATGARGPLGPIDYRMWVSQYTRMQCPDSHRHAEREASYEGGCPHEEVTILEYVKGPDGAPFRMSKTVHEVTKEAVSDDD